jgi:hypothetical protein
MANLLVFFQESHQVLPILRLLLGSRLGRSQRLVRRWTGSDQFHFLVDIGHRLIHMLDVSFDGPQQLRQILWQLRSRQDRLGRYQLVTGAAAGTALHQHRLLLGFFRLLDPIHHLILLQETLPPFRVEFKVLLGVQGGGHLVPDRLVLGQLQFRPVGVQGVKVRVGRQFLAHPARPFRHVQHPLGQDSRLL